MLLPAHPAGYQRGRRREWEAWAGIAAIDSLFAQHIASICLLSWPEALAEHSRDGRAGEETYPSSSLALCRPRHLLRR